MRNGATTLPTTDPTGHPTSPAPDERPAGPPPGPRSAGLAPAAPLLQRAPRRRPAPVVRQLLDLEAGSLLELLGDAPAQGADRSADESTMSIQDRVRLRAREAAAQVVQVAPWPGSTPPSR